MEEEDRRHLMVNYLPPTFNSDDVKELFSRAGPVVKCKLIHDHNSGLSLGYAFVEYRDEHTAANAMSVLSGMELHDKKLKVSYARPASTETKNRNVYVANLSPHLTEDQFHAMFKPYGPIETIRLLMNSNGTSRGVGLVRYTRSSDASFAIENMNEKSFVGESNGALIVKIALPPKHMSNNGLNSITANSFTGVGAVSRNSNVRYNPMGNNGLNVSTNSVMSKGNDNLTSIPLPFEEAIQPATVYVYGLVPTHTELTLYELFSPFGGILNVRAVRDFTKDEKPCKGFGFVNFTRYEDAHKAIITMNNLPFEGKVLRVSLKQNKSIGSTGTANYGNMFSVMAS